MTSICSRAPASSSEAVQLVQAWASAVRPTLGWARRITQKNEVRFEKPEDAELNGFVPCKVCLNGRGASAIE